MTERTYLDMPAPDAAHALDHDMRAAVDALVLGFVSAGADWPDVVATLRRIARDQTT